MSELSDQKYIIVVAGPTAVGKSDVAVQLAKHFDTAILSADARQCFREMNIGTAKPDEATLASVKHYFINSHSIKEEMSAGIYERYALKTLDTIFETKNVAIVCGGTGLYIQALLHGMDPMPPIDPRVEGDILAQYEFQGLDWLKEQLDNSDTEYVQHGEMNNPARMLRALIFYKSNGTSILSFQKGNTTKRNFKTIGIGLEIPRATLYDRIDKRVDQMVADGLYQEAASLFPNRKMKNLLTVGYQEFYTGSSFPKNPKDLQYAVGKIKQHSRNYAKRQLTWFKNKETLEWFAPKDITAIIEHCKAAIL